jgi:antitoxin ChpS
MLQATLRPVGGSLMIAIPKPLLASLDLKANSVLDISIESDSLVMKPRQKLKYSLEQLLAEWDANPDAPFRDDEWEKMPPVGDELL